MPGTFKARGKRIIVFRSHSSAPALEGSVFDDGKVMFSYTVPYEAPGTIEELIERCAMYRAFIDCYSYTEGTLHTYERNVTLTASMERIMQHCSGLIYDDDGAP